MSHSDDLQHETLSSSLKSVTGSLPPQDHLERSPSPGVHASHDAQFELRPTGARNGLTASL
jgi:hypothetical protein